MVKSLAKARCTQTLSLGLQRIGELEALAGSDINLEYRRQPGCVPLTRTVPAPAPVPALALPVSLSTVTGGVGLSPGGPTVRPGQ
jgi:hypothetical protein